MKRGVDPAAAVLYGRTPRPRAWRGRVGVAEPTNSRTVSKTPAAIGFFVCPCVRVPVCPSHGMVCRWQAVAIGLAGTRLLLGAVVGCEAAFVWWSFTDLTLRVFSVVSLVSGRVCCRVC